MDWEKQPPQPADEPGGGGMFVKVMTDEQMEVLRKQIACYATICEQLVELHKSLTSQTDLAGNFVKHLFCITLTFDYLWKRWELRVLNWNSFLDW